MGMHVSVCLCACTAMCVHLHMLGDSNERIKASKCLGAQLLHRLNAGSGVEGIPPPCSRICGVFRFGALALLGLHLSRMGSLLGSIEPS